EEWRITGLAVHLRISRTTIYQWMEEKREFSNIIKEACSIIEDKYGENCERRGNAGDIFILKNMGWKDKQEIEHSGSVDWGGVFESKKS
ncbi:MAG: terminase small subunit, partial [Candidatus Thermoplasmatota archaeon]|nr:terminase small subunit [Candidatus Thermoplasmatota archaeon]